MPVFDPPYDLVTVGEGFLRLSPARYERLEQAVHFDVHVIGAGVETAVAASRLGWRCAWLSAAGDTPLGRKVVNKAREHGVDVSGIVRIPEGRTGLCFAEPGSAPRPTRYFYDAEHTVFRETAPDELCWSVLAHAKHCLFFLTPQETRPGALETLEYGLRVAKEANRHIVVAVDEPADTAFSPETLARLSPFLEQASVLTVTLRAAQTLSGDAETPEKAAEKLKSRYRGEIVAVTDDACHTPRAGMWRAAAFAETTYQDRAYTLEIIDAGGAFSVFSAVFLHGLDHGPETALRQANAGAALMHSAPGHLSWFTLEDLHAQTEGIGTKLQR